MRKHFLLLFLMALLPLAGWAELTVSYKTGSPYEKTVTYAGNAFTLPSLTVTDGGSAVSGYECKLYPDEDCAQAPVTSPQVGTYYLKVTKGNDEGDRILVLNVAKAPLTLTLRNLSRVYGESNYTLISAKYFFDQVEGLQDGDEELLNNNITISNAAEFVNAGTYDVNLSIPSVVTKNYTIQYAGVQTPKLTIQKANASVTTAPEAENPTYTGGAQPLVSAGVATGGTINYSLDGVNYSDAIPTGTNAVEYTVYYKVVGDQNHNDTEAQSLLATIGKANASVTTAPEAENPTYTGGAQALVTAGATNDGTIQFSLNGVDYSDAIPTGTDAGPYTVYYKVVGDANHKDIDAQTINNVTIEKAPASVTGLTAIAGLTYNGHGQALVDDTNATVTGGTIKYSLEEEGDYSTTIPEGTDAAEYTVYYKVEGDNNHKNTQVVSIPATIDKADASVTTAPTAKANLTYTGSGQALVTAGTSNFGDILYSIDGENYSADIPEGTNAVDYTVYYKVEGTTNYNGTQVQSIPVTIAPKSIANATITIAAGNKVYKNAPWEPDFTVKVDQTTLVAGTDYEVTNDGDGFNGWSNNTNAGTASVKVRGIGNYKGETASQNFTIIKKPIHQISWIKFLTIPAQEYTGTQIKPEFVWQQYAGEDLTDHVDVTYGDNINAGTKTGSIKFTAKEGDTNYSDAKTIYFNIDKAPLTVTAKDITVGYGVPYTPAIGSYSETKNNEKANEVVTGTPIYKYYSDEACQNEDNEQPTAVGTYWYKVSGLTADNYQLSYAPAKIVITNGDLNAQVKDQEIVYGQKFNLTGALKHISGLSVNDTEAFNATDFSAATWTVKNHDTQAIVSQDYNGEYLDAGTYDVSVSNVSYTNYNVAVASGTWTVTQKNIADVTLGNLDGVDYKGVKVTAPSTEGKFTYTFEGSQEPVTLVEGEDKDYTVSDEGYANINVANGGKIKVTGTGNYTGSVEVSFAIKKVNWTITAQPASFKVNNEASAVYTAKIEGLVGKDLEVAEKLLDGESVEGFGTLTVAKANNIGTAVGTYPDGVVATYTGETANYNVPTINNADLQITQGSIVLYVKDATKTYGYAFNQADWSLDIDADNSDLTAEQASNWKSIVNGEENVEYATEYAQFDDVYDGENKKEYEVNVPNVNVLSSTNYAITVNPGKLTLDQQELQLTAQDQTINRGDDPDTEVRYEDSVDPEASKTVEAVGRLNDDDLGITIEIAEGKASIVNPEGHVGAITINTDNLNKNYKLADDPVAGTLFVNGAASITLSRTEGVEQLIKDYHNQTLNVKLDRNITRTEAWFAMVLPFEVSVTELSQKFGYAIVNVLDESNTDPSKVKFKINMQTIAANQPFLVKIASPITEAVDFGSKEIVYDAAPKSEDAAGNKFHGIFKTTALEASDNLWIMVPAQNKFNKLDQSGTTLTPINAYLETAQDLDSFAPSIFVEDLDGNVTAINGVGADVQQNTEGWYNLNGVKLQGVPTEKGVYIQNGKKVVIK